MSGLLEHLRGHKSDGRGIASVCSSHPLVIEAALKEAARADQPILIEATSNQVNQFGGYTGLKPAQFRQYVEGIAQPRHLPLERAFLGGDHLGPNAWRHERAAVAMDRARTLVADYVRAGLRKVHLDCSMSCADDARVLGDDTIARRAAELCRVAEDAAVACGGEPPVYVIGTEVPTPGGATEELGVLAVTTPEAVSQTLASHRQAFEALGLAAAWERVVALVVQPGVEFDHHKVLDYQPARARALSARLNAEPLVFEAHSTDYQTPAALAALVRDHFAILKVGPAATFALREALWALADIAATLGEPSPLRQTVLGAMRRDPQHWQAYYTDASTQELDLQYSLSDRIRYYWAVPEVEQAVQSLLAALSRRGIPLTLLSQYLPAAYDAVRAGTIPNEPRTLVLEHIGRALRPYTAACAPRAPKDRHER
ncbi:MAG: D-tagatose-bisphosphate aldolase, class II, non-catalytic subunit [Gammaproteobacteria bacterium]|nr:D-tagatose-bisphosphate aldolase, class II, non-catalytic subunit [Gammaproteobacteria bacterium]